MNNDSEKFGCGIVIGAVIALISITIVAKLAWTNFDETMENIQEKIETECVIHKYESYEKDEDKDRIVVTFRCD